MDNFYWRAVDNAPKNYPMEILFGNLIYPEEGSRTVPRKQPILRDWGEGIPTRFLLPEHFLLPESNPLLGPLPKRLEITFFSYTENQFYRGQFDLPYEKILKLFHDGYLSTTANEHTTYEQIVVGVAPGGAVSVWLTGIDKTTEVFFGQSEKTEILWSHVYDKTDISRNEYIQKKINESLKTPEAIKGLSKNGIPVGLWQTYRAHYNWQPVFTGMQVRDGLIESIKYFNGDEEYLRYPLDAAVATTPRAVPRELHFIGGQTGKADLAFKLNFEKAEILDAFKKLGNNKQFIQLELRAEQKGKGANYTAWLRSDKEKIQLKHTDIKAFERSSPDIEGKYTRELEQIRLTIKFNNALNNENALQDFLNVSQTIAANSPYIKEYAYLLTSYSNSLLNNSVQNKNFKSAEKIIYHYINELLPHTGAAGQNKDVAHSIEVIASNSLALAITTQNDAMRTMVFEKLLGHNFDITALKNGTLLFNLACYYAIKKEKDKLLVAMGQALIHGKKADIFMTDSDFKDYWDDADFMKALTPVSQVAKGGEGDDKKAPKSTQLHLAILADRKDTVELLLAKGVDINATGKDNETPLHLAAKRGNQDIAELLIAKGADVNAKIKAGGRLDETPLHWAAWYGKSDVVQLLITKGAQPDVKSYHGATPLQAAVGNVINIATIKLLLDHGVDVNVRDSSEWTPLHVAAADANKAVLALLISKHANVNAKSHDGTTPLHRAAEEGKKNNVEILLDNGADMNARDSFNVTPLHKAMQTINPRTEYEKEIKAVVEILIARGADINSKDGNGSTPLHSAASSGRQDVVKLLLAKGVDVNVQDGHGSTPLHRAVLRGNAAMAELLLASGADVNARGGYSQSDFDQELSPFDLAVSSKNTAMIKLLKTKGNVVTDPMNDDLNAAYAALEKEDIETALKLVKKHKDSGNARAQYMYGLLLVVAYTIEGYENAMNQEDDVRSGGAAESYKAYELAQKKEKETHQEAARWFLKAAEQDYAKAQAALGGMYEEGENRVVGHMWQILSASHGGDKEEIMKRIKRIDDQALRNNVVTPEEIEEAKKLAREWKPKK